jgi:hypothetical protein
MARPPVSGEGPAFAAPPPPNGSAYSGDLELEDLVFSWRRVTDPKLRKIALDLIRSMAS